MLATRTDLLKHAESLCMFVKAGWVGLLSDSIDDVSFVGLAG